MCLEPRHKFRLPTTSTHHPVIFPGLSEAFSRLFCTCTTTSIARSTIKRTLQSS